MGPDVGSAVGATVGRAVGANDGAAVGRAVGANDGVAVGRAVGARVGGGVGPFSRRASHSIMLEPSCLLLNLNTLEPAPLALKKVLRSKCPTTRPESTVRARSAQSLVELSRRLPPLGLSFTRS